ncbi:E3 SUMO-protein ligase ZBED1-like [Genypterus blacodes]|uniref:E3 SUMO-protein ligase ZBED1-like n=1 Tax=Genypterus blacodes TaxID=154954 RepID=UPI003F77346C
MTRVTTTWDSAGAGRRTSQATVKAVQRPTASGPQHPFKPGDWVLIKDFRRKHWKQRRFRGFQVLLTTHTTLKVKGRVTWVHCSHCKKLTLDGAPSGKPAGEVKCLLCHKELTYSNNTSSMIRHYRAIHENAQSAGSGPDTSQNFRKKMVDDALLNMVIKDSQPFTIVEDVGFKELIHVLDPTYVLPTRQSLKAMVDKKYEEAKEKAKEKLQQVASVSLTSDMWTSINMEAYLAVTCHFIDGEDQLGTILLGVEHFPSAHTADNLALAHTRFMEEWGIQDKVKCLVTDAAANMIACVNHLNVRHALCIAHSLNLIVKKSFDEVPGLSELRAKCRKMVTFFRTSTTAKETLTQVQRQMGRPVLKMIIEVDTRWNSTYSMLERLYDLREPVGAALASLRTEITLPTSLEYATIKETIQVLGPFQQATVELSGEKWVSASKVIPMLKMLSHTTQAKTDSLMANMARQLGANLVRRVIDRSLKAEAITVMTMPTLLDPRFKKLGFLSSTKLDDAIIRLKGNCAEIIRSSPSSTPIQLPETAQSDQSSDNSDLWHLLDTTVGQSRQSSSATADATIEVDHYLSEVNLARHEDPLIYWNKQKHQYPHLYQLALAFLCTPASSVPCERVFSKAGEIVSKKLP